MIAALVLALTLEGSAAVPEAGFVGAIALEGAEERFGGFSAIEVWPDGLRFLAISDRGAFVRGRFTRDAEGAITTADAGPLTRLRATGAGPLAPTRNDSEGAALAPDGSLYVSLEGAARLLHYPVIGGPAVNLPSPVAFAGMSRNASLEALAIDGNGTLYTLPERAMRGAGAHPVYRYRNGAWDQPFSLPATDGFLPVGADFGPDGRLYLLERRFRGLLGFSSRVRRFRLTEQGLGQGEVLLDSTTGQHDNLEGLSVWRDDAGAIVLTMVSDDNFNVLQRGQIVEYRVAE